MQITLHSQDHKAEKSNIAILTHYIPSVTTLKFLNLKVCYTSNIQTLLMYKSEESKALYYQHQNFTGKNSRNETEEKILRSIFLIRCKWKNTASKSQSYWNVRRNKMRN